jgi:hypothetical protein
MPTPIQPKRTHTSSTASSSSTHAKPKATEAHAVGKATRKPAQDQDALAVGGRPLGIAPERALIGAGARRSSLVDVRAGVVGTTTTGVRGGATSAPTRADFDKLATREDKPGAAFAPTVKFLITDADTPNPKLYFIDGNQFDYHWDFATKGLGKSIPLEQFNKQTYWNDNRKNIAGYVVAHDNFVDGSDKGKFSVEFWASDTVHAKHVAEAFKLIDGAMPFAKGKLVYHPQSDTQEELAKDEATALKQARVPVMTTEKLFANVSYSPLNPGEGYGVLRIMKAGAGGPPPSVRDVCVYADPPPNDLAHVAGLITAQPQTPLSHTNLKAKQNDTPNAYIKGVADDPKVKALDGKIVHFKVTPEGYVLEEATQAQADKFLESQRPKKVQNAPRDLTRKSIVAFGDLGAKDARAFGAKSANLAELQKVLGKAVVPDGFGIPFSFYDAFMKHKSLDDVGAGSGKKISPYAYAKKMMAEPNFKSDAAYREKRLVEFQKLLEKAEVPAELQSKIDALQAKFPAGTRIRCRSSTNNEDLTGFNGAGLYDSFTHRPREGVLSNTVKQVWASLWNFRAFEEREFWRIDHLKAAMGVTVHPNTDDEKANGVALTSNPFDANWRGFYINAQIGENLVTNPENGAVPEETLVSAIGEHLEYETQRIRKSNLTDGKPVLTAEQTKMLVDALAKIHDHFAQVYGKDPNDPGFGMDVEWKILENGKLWIKQARPVVH